MTELPKNESEPAPDNQPEHFPTKERLHTDVLEDKYGPIHSEVLEHSDSVRETFLVDEKGIARTYALTFFPEEQPNQEIKDVDVNIRNGGLIGKTFRESGFAIRKNVIDVSVLEIPEWLQKKFAVNADKAKARLSEFYAKREGGEPVVYGTVLEVYTSDFRAAEINDIDLAQVNPPTEIFQRNGINMDTIWSRLEDASKTDEWQDMGSKFENAKNAAKPRIRMIYDKVKERFKQKH